MNADFSHSMSRAVVLTGIPFAPAMDPRVKLKREFLDSIRRSRDTTRVVGHGFLPKPFPGDVLTGNEWCMQAAHRAVNQAIGRVIRNQSDCGAVLLLDSRFDKPSNKEGLSGWVRPHVVGTESYHTAVSDLMRFHRRVSQTDKPMTVAKVDSPTGDANERQRKLTNPTSGASNAT